MVDGSGGQRLLSWRTLLSGGPHHLQVQQALELGPEVPKAFLGIDETGQVEVLSVSEPDERQRILAAVTLLDARLSASLPDRWTF